MLRGWPGGALRAVAAAALAMPAVRPAVGKGKRRGTCGENMHRELEEVGVGIILFHEKRVYFFLEYENLG